MREGVRVGSGVGGAREALAVCCGCWFSPRCGYMGCPHTPEDLAGGVACDEELPESGKWLYKLILNDNLKRLTLLMVLL